MKRNIVWTLFVVVAMLSMSLASVAKDTDNHRKDGYTCSSAKVAGTWGYTETGYLIDPSTNPPTKYPYASVGRLEVDRYGHVSGRRTASLAGTILTGTIVGTITVKPGCTGTLTQTLTEDSTGNSSTTVKDIVFVDKATEARMIVTSNGAVLNVVAKKVSSGHGNEQFEDDGICSNATMAGTWGTTMTGTLFNPTTFAQGAFAAVNFATYDGLDTYWGTQSRSNNGTFTRVFFKGTYTVNSDCTGNKTTTAYADAGYTILLNTVDQDFVLVNDGKELIEIFTTVTLPQPPPNVVPAVVTGNSIRQFPNSEDEQ